MSDALQNPAWYCVRSQPKAEHIAAGCLHVLEGVEAYCPRIRYRRMTRRGPVWFSEGLFPGYLFSRFTPAQSQKAVTYARGVKNLVRFGEELAVISDNTISDLRAKMGEEDCKVIDAEVREGDTVTISDGIFKGLTTVVTQLLPARERVRVLLDFLGGTREVEVNEEHLISERAHFLSVDNGLSS